MPAIFTTLGISASTIHAITGTIVGSASARRKRAVRWKVVDRLSFHG